VVRLGNAIPQSTDVVGGEEIAADLSVLDVRNVWNRRGPTAALVVAGTPGEPQGLEARQHLAGAPREAIDEIDPRQQQSIERSHLGGDPIGIADHKRAAVASSGPEVAVLFSALTRSVPSQASTDDPSAFPQPIDFRLGFVPRH
jgi:hypothetical protein